MEISKELIEFVTKEAWVKRKKITGDTRLLEDLGITGDDAIDFIVNFGKTFNVDVSSFMAGDYFGPEGVFFVPYTKTFKIVYLQMAIICGRLDEETIAQSDQ